MAQILILGGSGFIGQALYKELAPYYNVHATYRTDDSKLESNQHFHQFDLEQEEVHLILDQLQPKFIVSALRGNINSLLYLHQSILQWIRNRDSRLIFLSSANVFDSFTHFPSYEYDKTFSESIYGRSKIKIENALLRLPPSKYVICRIPMIFGYNSPRVQDLKKQLINDQPVEVFPHVVINATHIDKLVQQLHYLINRRRRGIFHLGSNNLIHHSDLIKDICEVLGYPDPLIKQVYDSNDDRQLSVLPKDNLLPRHLQLNIEEVISYSAPKNS
ncbi:sugar nucleotide-binding protein [Nonlabens xiamenensis]|uniref:sugar nucleotide-binding protein n=1 Tax=Nonlabens xiamenensis TaxID=2341043 RepID=UPI000F604F40|nr:sugar nucleotide-binding protein [Nonlabens xiamenensis]